MSPFSQLLPSASHTSNSTTIHTTGVQTAVAAVTPDRQYKSQSPSVTSVTVQEMRLSNVVKLGEGQISEIANIVRARTTTKQLHKSSKMSQLKLEQ